MLDNNEINEVMDKLENLEDEELAVSLLREFNEKTRTLGQLLLNKDPDVASDEWKKQCDVAKKEVDAILEKIKSL